MLRMYTSESACLGSVLIMRFQTLSDGKTAHGPIRPPDGAGAGVLVFVTVDVGTGVGTLVAVRVLVFVAARVAVRVMVGVALRVGRRVGVPVTVRVRVGVLVGFAVVRVADCVGGEDGDSVSVEV